VTVVATESLLCLLGVVFCVLPLILVALTEVRR
jgi:hypothetical protein